MVKNRAARKSKKKSRPSTPDASKDDLIRFRILSTQKAALEAAAAREGLVLSTWLRQLALRAAGLLPRK